MLRSTVLVFLVAVGGAFSTWGQESAPRSFGVGWAWWELVELNESLQAQGYPTLAESCFIWGVGSVALPTGVLGEWSFSISNWYGNLTAQREDKLVRLVLMWMGGTAEHSLGKIAQAPFGLFAALSVGVGSATLSVLDHRPANFQEALRSPAWTFLTRWFFTIGPQLSASFPLITFKFSGDKTRSIVLKLSVSYTLGFDNGTWDQEGRALKGPPDNFNGWIIQLALGR